MRNVKLNVEHWKKSRNIQANQGETKNTSWKQINVIKEVETDPKQDLKTVYKSRILT